MPKKTPVPWPFIAGVSAGAGLAAYLLVVRPWQVRWGATEDEVARPMPGDEVVESPIFNATRALTVNARPEHIYPWIVQMGIRRAGWYSYDWVDNLGQPSSERIIPELQQMERGQLIPMSPVGEMGLYVKDFEKDRWILWWDKKSTATWCWGLYPTADGQTRLITRVRMRYDWTSPVILFDLALDAGDIIMMRKCMLGIKRRAERLKELENA